MNGSRTAVTVSVVKGKLLSIIGWGLMCLSVITLIVEAVDGTGDPDVVIGMLVLCAVWLWLIIAGHRISSRVRRFRRYVGLISTRGMTDIHSLAASTGKSADFVRTDVQTMIRKRFFTNARLDDTGSTIIIGENPPAAATPATPAMPATPDAPAAVSVTYSCKGCGASGVKPQDAVVRCDYCDTPN